MNKIELLIKKHKKKMIAKFRRDHKEHWRHSTFFQQWKQKELTNQKIWKILREYSNLFSYDFGILEGLKRAKEITVIE